MTKYTIATFVTVEADSPLQAAQKAFILHEEMTPEEFEVVETDSARIVSEEITLDQDQKDEARSLQRQGKLFEAI